MGGKLTFIDLFAGCGGLSEGFYKQGFEAVAHIEMNHWACETLRRRMRYYGDCGTEDRVLECDITSNDVMEKIDGVVNERGIDVIIGGPPCQAYSTAGRVRDSKGMSTDPRNYLFESYVKILRRYRPRYFVFENVLGVLSAKANGVAVFPQIIKALGEDYNVVSDPQALIHNTADFGVPQIRKRIIIIGVRKDLDDDVRSVYADIAPTHWNPETPEKDRTNRKRFVDVRQAIADLPSVEPGGDVSVNEYYYPCDNEFLQWVGKKGAAPLFDQRARNHNDMDRERFQQMIEHRWTFGQLRRAMPQYEHEKARLFDNSYVVQWWDLPSKTILAHLYKDGFQFIHPDISQRRTFTVREAARIQSFPDDFEFCGSRTEKYKQIGNAVPPMFAEVIAKAIKKHLREVGCHGV